MTTENLAIYTQGLTKKFRDFWGRNKVTAVEGLDLEVSQGEVFGLLGPNGSGKSTTIKVLLGLLTATNGYAKVLGHDPGDVATNARIGYLPEESYLYPFLNARETLDFYGRLFGLAGDVRKQRIESLLEMVGLASVSRRPIGEFSKGMQRRIGLAQALINDPELLILDEPTSGLDPIGTKQIKDLIAELGQRGKTVLLCSHLLADVESVCDRVCILYGGKKRDQGHVSEVLAQTDKTQLQLPRLSGKVLEEIKAVVNKHYGDCEFQVSNPHVSLEEYFLEIVRKAQEEQIATSGATMGGQVSGFLGQVERDKGQNIIGDLLTGKEIPVQVKQDVEAETVRVEAQQVREDVLGKLVETDKIEVKPKKVDKKEDVAEKKTDKSVIDDLLGG
ncbi:MAG: ABC transporter ATP-binding protein [Phycisphaerae bacterium]|nr:ABC transporter ATP-binding protein [Phycisphaerae bacterium]